MDRREKENGPQKTGHVMEKAQVLETHRLRVKPQV